MIYLTVDSKDFKDIIKRLEKMKWRLLSGPIGTGSFNRLMAETFVHMLKKNIISGKYIHTWMPQAQEYNKKYWKYKQKHGTYGNFWMLFGDLFSALSVVKLPREGKGTGVGYAGGVIEGSYNRKGKPIIMYMKVLEFGWRTIKKNRKKAGMHYPRPVYFPTLREFQLTYWRKAGKQARDDFAMVWRGK